MLSERDKNGHVSCKGRPLWTCPWTIVAALTTWKTWGWEPFIINSYIYRHKGMIKHRSNGRLSDASVAPPLQPHNGHFPIHYRGWVWLCDQTILWRLSLSFFLSFFAPLCVCIYYTMAETEELVDYDEEEVSSHKKTRKGAVAVIRWNWEDFPKVS